MEREQYDENKFAPYLDNDSRPMTRFLQSNEEDDEISFFAKAGIAVGGVIAARALMHRTGATRQITRFFDTQVKGSYQAAREIMQEQRPSRTMTRDLPGSIRRFNERRSELVKRQTEQMREFSRRGGAEEYDMQRYIRQREQMITEQVPFHIQEGLRYRDVLKEVEARMPKHAKSIQSAMESGDPGFLRSLPSEQVASHLRKHGVTDRDAIDQFARIQDAYRNKNYRADSEEARAWIEGIQTKMRKFTAEQMDSLTRKEARYKGVLNGHRQATVEDILAMNKKGVMQVDPKLVAHMEEIMQYNKKFGQSVFDENVYIRERNGKIIDWTDYKTYDDMRRGVKEWAAKTLPGGLMHMRDSINIQEAREIASFRIFNRDVVQPGLNAQRGLDVKERAHEPLIYVNGKFVRLFDENAVNTDAGMEVLNKQRDMFLTSSRFGTIGKVTRQVSGMMTEEGGQRNFFAGIFDLGRQDKDAAIHGALGRVNKFFNPDWERNVINKALQGGIDQESSYAVRAYFEKYSKGLSARSLNNMIDDMPASLREFVQANDITFSTQDDFMKVFRFMGEGDGKRMASGELKSLWQKYERDPDAFLHSKRPVGDSSWLGEYTNIQTGFDRIHQQLSIDLINQLIHRKQMNTMSPFDFRQYTDDLFDAGKLTKQEWQDTQFLFSHAQYKKSEIGINSNPSGAIQDINNLMTGKTPEALKFQDNVKANLHVTNPLFQKFSGTRPINRINDEYIAVNKAFESTTASGRFLEFFTDFGDKAKQMGLRTGRRNMEDFTNLSIFGANYPIYRLQDALGDLGLGFSDDSMTSPLKMMSSLMLKRFLPIYLGTQYAQYLDWEVEQSTGQSVSDRWENYKARTNLIEAWADDQSGKTEEEKRARMLTPGIDHFAAMPSIYLPGIGPVGPGYIAAAALGYGGTPIDEREAYSAEEYEEYLQYGEDEVRKSRWWLFGSKSAYRGDRVTEHRPNSYRLALSDAEDSDTNLTNEEQWSETNILPTFRNPLGGLAYAFGLKDPYYWERKHFYDRPYLITGSLFNPNTPFFGDIGNATIGQLIKPTEKMHPEYWGDPILMQEQTAEFGNRPNSPIVTRFSPGGRTENIVYADSEDYGANQYTRDTDTSAPRYIQIHQKDAEGNQTGAYVAQEINTGQAIYVPANVANKDYTIEELFNIAEKTDDETLIKTKPRAMFDDGFAYKQELENRKLEDLQDPTQAGWLMQEAWENWSEPLGVYKWILQDELFGYNPYEGKTVIEKADAAYNLSNAFQSLNAGSLGGQLSEIGRRFIRRDDGQLDKFNPIRNTMPDWLPGSDYFIDFQSGDPYQKIENGEYRLPGETYEKLNQLHPDETGAYGAFDKFKILADVAPWSDEYKFWRDYVVETNTDTELRKQAADIKRQVSQRKQKYEFTPYRFEGAELEYQQATVRKFLDDYSFVTEEFGDQVFRLAGVDLRGKAEGVLRSYVNVGDQVTIGLNGDESKQISNDTYKTARVVVYNKDIGNINRDILARGLMKENLADFSAAGVFSRFSDSEISKGAKWERIAHYESPLNTKFLQVRTALEEYERDQVYGKDWATWENFLIDDYLIPGFQSIIRHDLDESMMRGAVAGALVGGFLNIFGAGKKNILRSGIVGALGAGIGNLYRQHYEKETGEAWIPERRRIENDINEYFDVLKYMKFRGLYEQAKIDAAEAGYDVDTILGDEEARQEINRQRKRELEDQKIRLFIDQPEGWEDQRKAINKEIELMGQGFNEIQLPQEVLMAMHYKDMYERTVYGADPYSDRMKLASALPYKDKWFFDDFVEAPERDRQRILEVIPENQRRIYKALWGIENEGPAPLEEVFSKFVLPDPGWIGWNPKVDLEDMKVKAVQEAGLDMSDFNFWTDDVVSSSYLPDISPEGNDVYLNGPQFSGYQEMQNNIRAVLEGQGLTDVDIRIAPSGGNETNVNFRYEEDRSHEINNYFKENMDSLM
ncbi:hypothetical protein TCA2_4547 [Paenibacillus sp. TCA20]|uniref:hypothetical protein n=1 Tax=Paenibacillus sp. TCA20 TaxID=1499968 RepID=UPI0004D892D8|nr:hypothetical protein [Paenibacillus sp. TCA20]GAK42055.1 hypothetical protein TCA2_4547 [Paenibacillus sp. TCA20]